MTTSPGTRASVRPSVRPVGRPPLARIVMVTGKGGTGKTTVAAGLAALSHARSERSAFVEFGDGESGRRALRGTSGIEHIVIRPDEAIARAAGPLFGSAMVAKIALGNFAVRRLLKAAPGLRELAMLECIRLTAAEDPGRRVIVDMPATGHGLSWLRVPRDLARASHIGPFHDLCARIDRDVITKSATSMVVVTLPERLVVRETLDLLERLEKEVGLTAGRVVVNRMPRAPSRSAADDAMAKRFELPTEAVDAFVAALGARHEHRNEALASIDLLGGGSQAAPILLPDGADDPLASRVAEWLRGEGALP